MKENKSLRKRKSVYEIWVELYGEDEANRREIERRARIVESNKGRTRARKVTLTCDHCNVQYQKYASCKQLSRSFCSRECYNAFMKENPELNPNFNNRWSDEKKREASERTLRMYDETDLRHRVGRKGRIRTQESIEQQKITARRNGKVGKTPLTEEAKRKIGEGSSNKFKKDEYKKRLPDIIAKGLKTKAQNGSIVSIEERDAFNTYKLLSHWYGHILRFAKSEDLDLIRSRKMYHPVKNVEGVVRDHRLSKKTGFDLRIFTQILRHPENLAIITCRENTSKGGRLHRDTLTKDQLFQNIRTSLFVDWPEHKYCLNLIDRYEAGERWEPPLNEDEFVRNRRFYIEVEEEFL